MLDKEYIGALADMRSATNRQLWQGIKIQPKYPWVVKKTIAAYRWAHRKRGKHQGMWHHAPVLEDWYEDCSECGQPVKQEGHPEYWFRNCLMCNHYEKRDTPPPGWNAEMRGLEALTGKSFNIPMHNP